MSPLPIADGRPRHAPLARPLEAHMTVHVDRRGEHPLVTLSTQGRTVVRDFPVRSVLEAARLGHLIADVDPHACPTV